ncbi:MAG: tetratricopeptide repeat protein [Clostridiales bacterium]|nr:tetratricopeptide repeat protein [Clostridiales bacterium]
MKKLVFAIRHTANGFLYFVADGAGDQAEVVGELCSHFAAGEIAPLDAASCPSEFSFSILNQLMYDNPNATAYAIYNFQHFANESNKPRFYSSLNYTRDLWLRMGKLFIFGMPESFRTEIAAAAPNFYSIFLTGYNFCGMGNNGDNDNNGGNGYNGEAARANGLRGRRLPEPQSLPSGGVGPILGEGGGAAPLGADGAPSPLVAGNGNGLADSASFGDRLAASSRYGAAAQATVQAAQAAAQAAGFAAPAKPATRLDSGLEKHSRLSAQSILSANTRFNNLTDAVSKEGIQSEWSAKAERLYLDLLRAWLDCPDISYDWTGLLVADILDRLRSWSRGWSDTLQNADKAMILSAVHERLAQYDSALECCNQAMAIRERLLGKDAVDTAEAYSFAATIFSAQGACASALKWYSKALAVYERLLGPEHPFTATTYNNIALAYSSRGDYKKALDRYQKALIIKKRVFGEEHPDTAATYSNIATVYADSEEYPKALEWYRKALSIKEKVLGKKHPDTATTYNNIASVYADMGDYIKALDWFQNALDIRMNIFGKEHPKTAAVQFSMDIVRKELDYLYH